MPGSVARLTTLAIVLGSLAWAEPAARELIVVRNNAQHSVPITRAHGYPVVAATELADALGSAWLGGALHLDGVAIRFTEGSPFFSAADAVHQLANPVYRQGARLMIPVSFALDWLPRNRPARWRYVDGRLVARSDVSVRRRSNDAWLVVIDPGHGGPDPGTIGVGGTREKTVVLSIASELARRLESESKIQVVMTRDRDTLIALADRRRIARLRGIERPPDLFLSIHGNSMPRKPDPARGFETYFLAVARTEEARRVALRENASLQFEGTASVEELDPLQFILSDLQLTGNLQESNLFAGSINRSLDAALPAPDLGVKQAGFWVLVGATMPAALVEVGFLSNPSEEKLLRSPSYQSKIADALADAIVNYLSDYGRRLWTSSETG